MRIWTLLGIGLAVIVGGSSARAQQGAVAARETLQQLDSNGDMIIERDEVPESGRAAFDRLLKRGDANKDGKLEFVELRDLLQKAQGAAGPAAQVERFLASDKNNDGKVSKDEFPGGEPLFALLDADKDGSLTKEEISKFRAGDAIRAMFSTDRFKTMDKNGDGKISTAEYTGPEPIFTRLDANKDGFVTRDEVSQLLSAAQQAGGPPAAAPKPAEPAKPTETPKPKSAGAPRPKGAAVAKAQVAKRILSMDKDGDGKISKAEFQGRPERFERLDANKDGFLTKDELPKGP
jgi:Ca2+-binding EF-hand superfamily protein